MNNRARLALAAGLVAASAAQADDITGADTFICTAWHATVCTTEATCEQTEAWKLDMPDFLKVDLDEGVLSTPERSDAPRYAEIESIHRNAGRVFLNGWQQERGFSWVINEASGEGTIAIVNETTVVTLFTACAATDVLR